MRARAGDLDLVGRPLSIESRLGPDPEEGPRAGEVPPGVAAQQREGGGRARQVGRAELRRPLRGARVQSRPLS